MDRGKAYQLFDLIRRERVIVGQKAGDRSKTQYGSLIIGEAKVERVQLPFGAKRNYPAVVVQGLWNPRSVDHDAADFRLRRSFRSTATLELRGCRRQGSRCSREAEGVSEGREDGGTSKSAAGSVQELTPIVFGHRLLCSPKRM